MEGKASQERNIRRGRPGEALQERPTSGKVTLSASVEASDTSCESRHALLSFPLPRVRCLVLQGCVCAVWGCILLPVSALPPSLHLALASLTRSCPYFFPLSSLTVGDTGQLGTVVESLAALGLLTALAEEALVRSRALPREVKCYTVLNCPTTMIVEAAATARSPKPLSVSTAPSTPSDEREWTALGPLLFTNGCFLCGCSYPMLPVFSISSPAPAPFRPHLPRARLSSAWEEALKPLSTSTSSSSSSRATWITSNGPKLIGWSPSPSLVPCALGSPEFREKGSIEPTVLPPPLSPRLAPGSPAVPQRPSVGAQRPPLPLLPR